jgi:UDP-N-acetyl-D-galactosamine dehydrogenase
MDIPIHEVLAAASTKWNFLPFEPGLVGGHCIGVDPYYLTYKAQQLGFHPEVILSGRRINDAMGKYIAELTIKEMIKRDLPIRNNKVGILGFTFKQDCPDVRNTKVIDIIKELASYHIEPVVFDPIADSETTLHEYDLKLASSDDINQVDVLIAAVPHQCFKEQQFQDRMVQQAQIMVDVKNIFGQAPNIVKL